MITVVGIDGSALSAQAEEALASATLVAGARRHLAAARMLAPALALPGAAPARAGGPPPARTLVLGALAPALDALASHDGDAVVLASGDPGFFGIVRALRERGLDCTVLPAVSSVAVAFARAGLPWDDAVVVSAHGRDPRPAVNVCRAHPKVAVLTGPGRGPAEIGAALVGWDRRLLVAERLGTEEEHLTKCSPAEAAQRTWEDPNVVLVLGRFRGPSAARGKVMNATFITQDANERHIHQQPRDGGAEDPAGAGWLLDAGVTQGAEVVPRVGSPAEAGAGADARGPGAGLAETGARADARGPGAGLAETGTRADDAAAGAGWLAGAPGPPAGWALAEEEFDSRDAVLTKAEVRALALARLGPGPGLLVWDVGAGSGSVGIECARFGAAVIAVERDPVRCERIAANASRHGVDVRVVSGEAPGILAQLPDPDVAFVGGGGAAAIGAVTARRPARIVVALAAVERAGPACDALAAAGYAAGGALVQAARLAPLPGDVHRLAATNPVFLIWGTADPGSTETASLGELGDADTTESAGPAEAARPAARDTDRGVWR